MRSKGSGLCQIYETGSGRPTENAGGVFPLRPELGEGGRPRPARHRSPGPGSRADRRRAAAERPPATPAPPARAGPDRRLSGTNACLARSCLNEPQHPQITRIHWITRIRPVKLHPLFATHNWDHQSHVADSVRLVLHNLRHLRRNNSRPSRTELDQRERMRDKFRVIFIIRGICGR